MTTPYEQLQTAEVGKRQAEALEDISRSLRLAAGRVSFFGGKDSTK